MAVTIDTTIPPASVNLDGVIQKYSGTTGKTLYDTVTTEFVTPSLGGSVTLSVGDTTRYSTAMYIYITDIGVFKVASIPSKVSLTIVNIDTIAGIIVPVGVVVTSASRQSVAAPSLTLTDTSANIFNIPAAGNTSNLTVSAGGWLYTGMRVFINGAGWYIVQTITDQKNVVVLNPNVDASYNAISMTSGTVAAGARVFISQPYPFTPDNDTIIANNTGGVGDARIETGRTVMRTEQTPAVGDTPYMESGVVPFQYTNPVSPWVTDITNGAILFTNPFKTSTVPVIQVSISDTLATLAGADPQLYNKQLYTYGLSSTGFVIAVSTNGVVLPISTTLQIMWTAIGVR